MINKIYIVNNALADWTGFRYTLLTQLKYFSKLKTQNWIAHTPPIMYCIFLS